MRRFPLLLMTLLLLGGCFWHKSTPPAGSPLASETAAPAAAVATPAVTSETVPVPTAPTSQISAQPSIAPLTKSVSKPTQSEQSIPVASLPQTAPRPTEKNNVPPVPDVPVFPDEPAFPLEGRRLGPLAALTPRPDQEVSSPWQGEQLKYGLYYSFAKVGTAYIKNRGLVNINGRDAYLIQTTAFSASIIDTVFRVRDINLSWLDAQHLHSLGYSQSLREGHYRRDEWVMFDYTHNTYQGEVDKKSGLRALTGTVTQPVLDMLTSLYFVRGQELAKGKDIIFDILNREEQYPLVVKVIKRETVKTPAGKFKCIVVEPQFRGEGIFVSKGKSLQVWLTDDERKLPVKMKTEVFIGSVSAELLEYRPN